MKHIGQLDKRKLIGAVIGTVVFISCVLFFTYAYYNWKSSNTLVSFDITDANTVECLPGPDVNVINIGPVLNYQDGVKAEFSATNNSSANITFSLTLDITSISNTLLVESFKYKLVQDKKGGTDYDYDHPVVEGNFSKFKVGSNLIKEDITTGAKATYTYQFIVYIDGTMYNNTNMQQNSLNSNLVLGDCIDSSINVSLNYNGGKGEVQNLRVVSTYEGLPTPTKDSLVVSYNTNGGSAVSNDTVNYTFDGWYLESSFQTKITASSPLASQENHTLYAKWNASKTIKLPTTSKTGYTFQGWYSDSALTKKVGNAGDTYNSEKSITLYAKWALSTYTVSVNTVTGGSVSASSSASYGSTVTITTNPSSGFTYYGATVVDSSGTTVATLSSSQKTFTMPASNVTVKPKWKYNDLTILQEGTATTYTSNSFQTGKSESGGGTSNWSYLDSPRYFLQIQVHGMARIDVLTKSPINITHYATISAGVQLASGLTTSETGIISVGIVSNTSSWIYYASPSVAAKQVTLTNTQYNSITVDITNYTGNYYVGAQLLGSTEWNGWIKILKLIGRVYQ